MNHKANGLQMVFAERLNQQFVNNRTTKSDKNFNAPGSLRSAAAAILTKDLKYWPSGWDSRLFNHIMSKSEDHQCAAAGALCCAAIDYNVPENELDTCMTGNEEFGTLHGMVFALLGLRPEEMMKYPPVIDPDEQPRQIITSISRIDEDYIQGEYGIEPRSISVGSHMEMKEFEEAKEKENAPAVWHKGEISFNSIRYKYPETK